VFLIADGVLADFKKGAQVILEYCSPGDALVDNRDKHRHLWEAPGGLLIHHNDAGSLIDAWLTTGSTSA
jgi:hypothetical protein